MQGALGSAMICYLPSQAGNCLPSSLFSQRCWFRGCCAPCARLLLSAAAAPLARGFCSLRLLRTHARGGCSRPAAAARSTRAAAAPDQRQLCAHARGGCFRPAAAARSTRSATAPDQRQLCAHARGGCTSPPHSRGKLSASLSLSRVSLSGPHVLGQRHHSSHVFSLSPHTHSLTNTNNPFIDARCRRAAVKGTEKMGFRSVAKRAGAPKQCALEMRQKSCLKHSFIHSFILSFNLKPPEQTLHPE